MQVSFLNQGTILAVEWPDFDAYVGSLSKSMRKDYRRHCNRAADLGIRVARHASSSELGDWRRARKLVQNVNEKHRLPFLTSVREWRIMEHADEADSTWISAKIDDELVGWALLLSDGAVMHLSILGIDYGIRYTYFQLFYEAIHCAIDQGRRAIRGGYAAYDTKRRLGFQLEGQTSVRFVGNGAFLQKVAHWVANRFEEDEL
jgi:predicted N-acyltransferase